MPDFPKAGGGGGATAAEVWAYGTKELSGDSANAVRDAILSDATKIPGGNLDEAISTVKAKTDNLPDDPADQSLVEAEIATRAPASEYDVPMGKVQGFTEDSLGTLTATGAEDDVRESLAEGKLHAFVDLTAMQVGDSITVRQFIKIKAAGSYIKYAEEVYADVQALPMLYIVTKPGKHGIKITLEQTAGTYCDFDWETFIEKAA